jgi:hypothetical protein
VLGALCARGQLHRWLQQNHDGLPQKAGVPQERLNEIHGAWHDPSNPVVPMSGTLRGDLCEQLYEWEATSDLVLALGTSLCGMNADRVVESASERSASRRGGGGGDNDHARNPATGAVIVTLQQTQYDDRSALRIFALLDDVMAALAAELGIPIPPQAPYAPKIPRAARLAQDVFDVPYDNRGRLVTGTGSGSGSGSGGSGAKGARARWNLQPGARVRVTRGPGAGFTGKITGKSSEGHYRVTLPCQREGSKTHGKGQNTYLLGSWWVQAAVEGKVDMLPIVNVK